MPTLRRSALVASALLAGLAGCASAALSQTGPATHALAEGPWLFTITRGGNEMAVRMHVEPTRTGGWRAASRPGAAGELLSWPRRTMARLLGKLPARGALLYLEDGTAAPHGDSVRVRGTLESPLLGRYHLAGAVAGGRLRGVLRRDSLGPAAGSVDAAPYPGGRPVRDYPALGARIRRELAGGIYNPALVERPEWKAFFRGLDAGLARAGDATDAMVAVYAARRGVRMSHLELFRDPASAALSLDSLMAAPSRPDALVSLTFPAPGVARLHVRRWAGVSAAVHRAFVRIDSAAPHTLILDVRRNPGGDVSSMSPAAHLLRDSTHAGVFLGRKWYREHRGPPTPAQRAAFPVLSNESTGRSVIFGVREHGALAGIVPPLAPRFDGTVYLLTDRGTGSASEPLAHLLKTTGRATLIGENTAGAMLSAPPHAVGDGWMLVYPEADYYTADGKRLEGPGVAPHVATPSARAMDAVAARLRQRAPYAAALLLGLAHSEAARWSEAGRAYREALRLEPDSAAPLHGLGFALQQEKRWAEASESWERALARDANDPVALYQLGRTAALSGERLERGEAALRAYLRAPARPGQPSHGVAHWRLGIVLEKRGRRDEARREYEAASRLEPANAEIRAALLALAP